jgi:hypothetical protein
MWNRVKAINPDVDVPNGIAYDSTTKKIFVTGKYWPEMYEIQLGSIVILSAGGRHLWRDNIDNRAAFLHIIHCFEI